MTVHSALPYLLTLASTLTFSSSSLIFATYSRRVSVLWMNAAKAFVALVFVSLTVPILLSMAGPLSAWVPPTTTATMALFISGAIALGIGDLFLLDAFVRIGVSRTLMLYGFQPIFLGLVGSLALGQTFALDIFRVVAIATLIGCLLIFSLERYRQTQSWELRGLAMAVIGVSMDSIGVLLTRYAFDQSPHTQPLEGHFIRCLGALFAYAMVALFIHGRRRIQGSEDRTPVVGLISNFLRFDGRSRALLILGCFGGTFLSLCFYLTAIQIGHLASISAITITGPMFAALLESVVHRHRPSRYLLCAFALFIAGFTLLLFAR